MEKQTLVQMEHLRNKLVETAMLKQNLLHGEVISLSQSLDKIIIQVQRERLVHARHN
jgi:hypothetical protein